MWAKRLKIAGALAGGAYVLAAGALALGYRSFLYPARSDDVEPSVSCASLVRITRAGEPTVFALYAPAPSGAPTLVRFHGNGEDLVDEAREVRAFHELGVGVLSVEYPGYGLARDQAPSEPALYSSAERAIAFLREQGVEKDATVVVGFSLGTGVAAEMARRGLATRAVLIAPYTSIPDVISHFVPVLPVGLLVRDRFDTLSKAASIDVPVLVVHGDRDNVIPPAMGDRVAAALPHATALVVQGGHHNDLPEHDPRLYSRIVRFARGESLAD
jgi:pimeloyl-ACP methyl ester carboxylesterase